MKPLVLNKTRFNVFDLVLCLVLLSLAVGLVLYLAPLGQNRQNATFTLSVSGVREGFLARLSTLDTVYDQSGNVVLGKIKSISYTPDTLSLTDPKTGETVVTDYPEGTLYTLVLEISTENASLSEEGELTVFGTLIAEGKTLSVRTQKLALAGICGTVLTTGGAK